MKVIGLFCLVAFLTFTIGIQIDSAMDTDGKLEAHATAKKDKNGFLRCLAKGKSDDIKIVNGWWGLSVQIDSTTWVQTRDTIT